MSLSLAGAFPQQPQAISTVPPRSVQVVLADTPTLLSPARTTGQTLSIPLAIEPPIQENWSLLGMAIELELYLFNPPGTFTPAPWMPPPPFGRLGKIIAGLWNFAGQEPLVQLPADTSLIDTVWDGSQDNSPPFLALGATPPTPPLTISKYLPQQITLPSGQQLCFGIAITPSLVNGVWLFLTAARYSIQYEQAP